MYATENTLFLRFYIVFYIGDYCFIYVWSYTATLFYLLLYFCGIMILLTIQPFLAALQLNCFVVTKSHATSRQGDSLLHNATKGVADRLSKHARSSAVDLVPKIWSILSTPRSLQILSQSCRHISRSKITWAVDVCSVMKPWQWQVQLLVAVFTCLYNAGSPWDFLSSTTYKEGLSSNTWDHKWHNTSLVANLSELFSWQQGCSLLHFTSVETRNNTWFFWFCDPLQFRVNLSWKITHQRWI